MPAGFMAKRPHWRSPRWNYLARRSANRSTPDSSTITTVTGTRMAIASPAAASTSRPDAARGTVGRITHTSSLLTVFHLQDRWPERVFFRGGVIYPCAIRWPQGWVPSSPAEVTVCCR